MSKVAVVTDSTAYLPTELLKRYHITVIPLSVIWGEQVYQNGVDILPGEFQSHADYVKVTIAAMQEIFQVN